MRALLYKDLVVNRGTILSYLVLAVVVFLLPYVGGHWVFPLAITLVFPVAYLQQEHKEKWLQLAAVLPYSPWAVVGARYVVTALAGAITAGCALLKQLARHGLAELLPSLSQAALALALFLLLQGVLLPSIYALGPDRILEVYLIFFGLVFVGGMLFFSLTEPIFLWFSTRPGVMFALGLALFLVSLPIAVGRYARQGW